MVVFCENIRRTENENFILVNDPSEYAACYRQFESPPSMDLNGHCTTLKSKAICNNNTTMRAYEIRVAVISVPAPIFLITSYINSEYGLTLDFDTMVIFDNILEYNEGGYKPGYSPFNDTIVQTFSLLNSPNSVWTNINYGEEILTDDITKFNSSVYTFTFSNSQSNNDTTPTVTFIIDVTECVAMYGQKVLLPNSIKITTVIKNLLPKQPNTEGGYAIGALILTKRIVSNINSSGANESIDVPDRASSLTNLIELEGNPALDQDCGYFSFAKQAFLGLVGNDMIDINPSTEFLENFNGTEFNVAFIGVATRLYFSILNKSVSSVEWNVAVGIDEYLEKISPSSGAIALIFDNHIALYIYDILLILIYILYK